MSRRSTLIVLFNKPYGVLCQFRTDAGRSGLADYIDLPEIYPAGRLDHDSEGLLVLTDDGALAHRLTDPRHKRAKTYVVQVEGEIDEAALQALRDGIVLRDGPTLPAQVRALDGEPQWLWPRMPPVRFRRALPTAWLELRIREGRNRQVRRMTAAVGLPTLRLIRTAVADYTLAGLPPGASQLLDANRVPADPARAARARAPAAGRPRRGRR